MTHIFLLFILFFILFAVELVYFKIADRYNIIDHPNERSSHTEITIRGGGIIFLLAAIALVMMHPAYWLPALGILIIGLISFADDLITLSSRIRLFFQVLAVTIMFWFLDVFHIEPFYICIPLYIMIIGIINMYNFMDGINGITGTYSLVVLGGLQYVNLYQAPFIDKDFIWIPLIASTVFLYFNFRTKAKCFLGDVGSVTIAFWISMLLLKLILDTGNWSYILFLVVYGVDSLLTITHRLMLKQNILKAHRLHFYQVLANENKISQLLISIGYSLMQLIIITFIVLNTTLSSAMIFCVCITPLLIIYLLFKPRLMTPNGQK